MMYEKSDVKKKIETRQATLPYDLRKPYPCGYCHHYAGANCETKGIKKIVKSMDDFCLGGLRKPDSPELCSKFALSNWEVQKQYSDEALELLQPKHIIEMLVHIYSENGITQSKLINRKKKGYVQRNNQIEYLINNDLAIQIGNNIYLTYIGRKIAENLFPLLDTITLCIEEKDLLKNQNILRIFDYINSKPKTSKEQLVLVFGKSIETKTDMLTYYLDLLIDGKYINPEFIKDKDGNYSIIFVATELGKAVREKLE